MKNIFYITLSILLSFTLSSSAEAGNGKKVYKGYVVLMKGDTLHGKIEMLSPSLNEVKVKLIGRSGTKRTLKAKEVASYAFIVPIYKKDLKNHIEEWIVYTNKKVEKSAVPFGPKNVLIERQVAGTVNMYNHYVEERANSYKIQHIIYVEKGKDMIVINRKNYRRTLKNLMSDNPDLQDKIGTLGYGFRYVSKIIAKYNRSASSKSGSFL